MGTFSTCLQNILQCDFFLPLLILPWLKSYFSFHQYFSFRPNTWMKLQDLSTPVLDFIWKKEIWGSMYHMKFIFLQGSEWVKINKLEGTAVGRLLRSSVGTIKISYWVKWQHRKCLWQRSAMVMTEGCSWLQTFRD